MLSVSVYNIYRNAGTEGREIYNTFNVVEGEQNKIQPLFDAFDGYCKPKENITVERYRFNLRYQ